MDRAVATLRQPIVSLLGHVDHGKTTLLDRITGSARAAKEAGGITQHIGAFEVPGAAVARMCEGILKPGQLRIPGFLFIDTPGHRSFETLRRRGGALADLALLVIDARDGVMPQTRESRQILRHEKTPFAVALTKTDMLPGWRKPPGPVRLTDWIGRSGDEFAQALDDRVYRVAESLVEAGFSADRYDRVSDFTRNVGILPVSAKFGVGIPELIALMVGLSQRFLEGDLELVTRGGEATILERSDQKGVGPVGHVIVYRGALAVGDSIVVTGRSAPFETRIRGLFRPKPAKAGRSASSGGLESLDRVEAAAGVFLAAPGIDAALPGGLLKAVRSDEERAQVQGELAREAQPVAELAPSGVAIYADALGGLEALAFECREAQIPIHEAGVGPVGRPTVLRIAAVKEPLHRAILAFNVPILPEALVPGEESQVRVFTGDVMYRLLEEYGAWKLAQEAALNAQRRIDWVHLARFEVLPGFVFRASKPAIVGIRVMVGTLRPGTRLMKPDGTEVGSLRGLQKDGKSVASAAPGEELAASIEGAVVGRNLKEGDQLMVSLPAAAVRALRSVALDPGERELLEELVRLRRRTEPFWGQ